MEPESKKYVMWILDFDGEWFCYKVYEKDIMPERWKQISQNDVKMEWSLAYYEEKPIPKEILWIYKILDEAFHKYVKCAELSVPLLTDAIFDKNLVKFHKVYNII